MVKQMDVQAKAAAACDDDEDEQERTVACSGGGGNLGSGGAKVLGKGEVNSIPTKGEGTGQINAGDS